MDPFAITYPQITNAQQFWLELDEALDSAKNVIREDEEGELVQADGPQGEKHLGRKQIANILQSFLALIDGCYGE